MLDSDKNCQQQQSTKSTLVKNLESSFAGTQRTSSGDCQTSSHNEKLRHGPDQKQAPKVETWTHDFLNHIGCCKRATSQNHQRNSKTSLDPRETVFISPRGLRLFLAIFDCAIIAGIILPRSQQILVIFSHFGSQQTRFCENNWGWHLTRSRDRPNDTVLSLLR